MAKNDNERVICPIFPQADGKSGVYADEIKRLHIYRQVPNGKGKRALIPKSEYTMSNGSTFEFDPFSTTEDEIEEFFGGGEFFIEPIGHNNNILPGSRTLTIDAPRRGAINQEASRPVVPAAPAIDDPSQAFVPQQSLFGTRRNPFMAQEEEQTSVIKEVLAAQAEATERMAQRERESAASIREVIEKKDDAVARMSEKMFDAAVNRPQAPSVETPLVESLRRQVEEIHARNAQEMRDLHARHSDDLRRLNRENEDERTRYRADMDRRDRAADEQRRAMDDQIREMRQRFDRDLEDARKRSERYVTEDSERYQRKIKDLEKELDETRAKLQKRVNELEKETLELTRELASIPEPAERDEKGEGGGPGMPEDAPWWGQMIPDVIKTVAEMRGAPGQQQQQPQQAQVEQLPAPSPAPRPSRPKLRGGLVPPFPARKPVPAAAPAPAPAPAPAKPAVEVAEGVSVERPQTNLRVYSPEEIKAMQEQYDQFTAPPVEDIVFDDPEPLGDISADPDSAAV